jgi:cystathionine beta-synthase
MASTALEFDTILDTIGHTPLVKLQRINPNPLVTILCKVEFMNPGGSIKDRMVLHILDEAERTGLLKPGGTIIENTSGNTGAAAAMIGAIRGYKVILTMPDKVSQEKHIKTLHECNIS